MDFVNDLAEKSRQVLHALLVVKDGLSKSNQIGNNIFLQLVLQYERLVFIDHKLGCRQQGLDLDHVVGVSQQI